MGTAFRVLTTPFFLLHRRPFSLLKLSHHLSLSSISPTKLHSLSSFNTDPFYLSQNPSHCNHPCPEWLSFVQSLSAFRGKQTVYVRPEEFLRDSKGCLAFAHQKSNLLSLRTKRHGGKISFALDTGGISNNNGSQQDSSNDDGDGQGLGGTRLGRIVSAGGKQLLEKLNAARKNFPMKVFLLLLGFYTANALATILGQTGDWDVLVAGVVVAAIEGIGVLMYRKSLPFSTKRLKSLVVMINYWKAGVCLGLFVDAFKLGS